MNSHDSFITQFLKQESAGGIVLVAAAILAMILANSPLSGYYDLLIDTPVAVSVGEYALNKPLLLWVNDGLMAMFFLLVGLELKREVLEGELSQASKVVLPAVGAAGGMMVPALIYSLLNADDPVDIKGWAIPAATDIAFALGALSLLGPRVPVSVKVFLTSLAIFDDIGAILIIAFFYTSHISIDMLAVALACCLTLWYLNRRGVTARSVYLFVGLIMWTATLKSGVHATLAGALLALFIPMRATGDVSPLKDLEEDLHMAVAFIILPVFAFFNAGISLHGVGFSHALHDVPLGIALGLFLGNQIGILGFCWLAIRLRLTRLPDDMPWPVLWGTAALCGIGFTMSLFISSLAFEETGINRAFDERLGIIIGSLASGLAGFAILKSALPRERQASGAQAQ